MRPINHLEDCLLFQNYLFKISNWFGVPKINFMYDIAPHTIVPRVKTYAVRQKIKNFVALHVTTNNGHMSVVVLVLDGYEIFLQTWWTRTSKGFNSIQNLSE